MSWLEKIWLQIGYLLFNWHDPRESTMPVKDVLVKGMSIKDVNLALRDRKPVRTIGTYSVQWLKNGGICAKAKDPYILALDAFMPKTKSEIIDELIRSLEKREWE